MNLPLLLSNRKKSSKAKQPIQINSVGIEHTITGIDWPIVWAKDAVSSAALAHTISDITWWNVPLFGDNLFLNPGFEDGIAQYSIHDDTVEGFTGQITSTSVEGEFHSGTKAAKLVSGTTDPNVITRLSQDCATTPGKTYMVSFWCRGDGVNIPNFFIYDRTTDASITPEPVAITGLTTSWKQVSYVFTAPVGGLLARTVLYAPYVIGGTCWYDDLFFAELTPYELNVTQLEDAVGVTDSLTDIDWWVAPPVIDTDEAPNTAGLSSAITSIDWSVIAPNLWDTKNPDFESDFANWTKNDMANGNHGTASIATAAGEFYSGSKACKLVADPVTYYDTMPWVHRDTILQPSTNYRLSFWSKGDGTNTGKFFVQDKTTNTSITPTDVSFGNTSNTWQQTIFDFTTPAGASNIRVFLQSSGAIGSTLWIDECYLGLR